MLLLAGWLGWGHAGGTVVRAQQPFVPEPSTAPVFAPPPAEAPLATMRPLSLADLEQMAVQANPSLAQARHRVSAARGEWLQAGLLPNPVVGYSGEEMGDDNTAGKQGGFVAQEFITAGKLKLNRAVASHEIARLEQEAAAQQYRVLTDVRTSFYAALVAQHRTSLTEQLARIGQESVVTADALLRAKEASRVGLLQSRVEANNARILLDNARNDHLAAWRRLQSVVGMPELPPATLLGEIGSTGAMLEWEAALAQLTTSSPEMAAAAAEVHRARCAVERAAAGRYPDIATRASVHRDNTTGQDIAGVEIGMALPIFDRNQGNLQKAHAELAAAQRNLDRVRLGLHHRLASVFQQYANARQQADRYRDEILRDAKESLGLVTEGYRNGEFGYLDLLTAQRTYFESNLAYLDALLQMHTARSKIDGFLLSESLGSTNE
jgi:cobalt-zinc-cadmium efflux system outer membrane protein